MNRFLVDFSASKKADKKFFLPLRRAAAQILRTLRFKSAALSVLLVRDAEMARLNWKLMRHKGTTDVLSFSYLETRGKVRKTRALLNSNPPAFLGEIIICLDTARRNAEAYGTAFEYESALYLCHGILHCLGYEDESRKGFLEMQKKQTQILNKVIRSKR